MDRAVMVGLLKKAMARADGSYPAARACRSIACKLAETFFPHVEKSGKWIGIKAEGIFWFGVNEKRADRFLAVAARQAIEN
jgi:hypothetical protein